MNEDFDRILDECVDRINGGDTLADCLSDYPAYSEKLRPLLQSMHDVQKVYAFTPSADSKRAARQELHAALGKRTRCVTAASPLLRLISRRAFWATVALLILAIVGSLVVRSAFNARALVASPDGNFAFLISDEPNDVNDFEYLDVTISRVRMQTLGSDKWLEFTPNVETVDLTGLQGQQFQEIWRGHVPAGQYVRVRIYVSEVKGKLESTGQTTDLNVPGGIVHMLIPFEVTADMITIYTFDITVVATGDDGTYMLKLQLSDSGARQEAKLLG